MVRKGSASSVVLMEQGTEFGGDESFSLSLLTSPRLKTSETVFI